MPPSDIATILAQPPADPVTIGDLFALILGLAVGYPIGFIIGLLIVVLILGRRGGNNN